MGCRIRTFTEPVSILALTFSLCAAGHAYATSCFSALVCSNSQSGNNSALATLTNTGTGAGDSAIVGDSTGPAPAIVGENTSLSGGGPGLYGFSNTNTAVIGISSTSAGLNGVEGLSNSTGASGVYGENDSTGGFGVAGRANGTSGVGVMGQGGTFGMEATCTGTGPGAGLIASGNSFVGSSGIPQAPAIEISTGDAFFSGANPSPDAGFVNTLTPKNVIKAWAVATIDTSCKVTIGDGLGNGGFNIGSASATSAGVATFTFASPMNSPFYAWSLQPSQLFSQPSFVAKSASTFVVSTGSNSNGCIQSAYNFIIFGGQGAQ